MYSGDFDIIIVGGGVTGASIALALIQDRPELKLALYAGAHTHTASKDPTKIIRVAYPDDDASKIAQDAMEMWKAEDLYHPFLLTTSWVQISGNCKDKIEYRLPTDERITTVELRERTKSHYQLRLMDHEQLWQNNDIGLVNSTAALLGVIASLRRRGVTLYSENVDAIVTDTDGVCRGIKIGESFVEAQRVILSAGAWSPQILKASGIRLFNDDREETFLKATAVAVAELRLSPEESRGWGWMPIVVTPSGEIIPTKDANDHITLKITTTNTFTVQDMAELERMPVDIEANREVLRRVFPHLAHRDLQGWNCPDLVTTDQYPVIGKAPYNQGLFLAFGGSYHSFKFFPIIGSLFVRWFNDNGRAAEKTHEKRFLQRCSLIRHGETPLHPNIYPKS